MEKPDCCRRSSNNCALLLKEHIYRTEQATHEQTPYPAFVTRNCTATHLRDPRLTDCYFTVPTTPYVVDPHAPDMHRLRNCLEYRHWFQEKFPECKLDEACTVQLNPEGTNGDNTQMDRSDSDHKNTAASSLPLANATSKRSRAESDPKTPASTSSRAVAASRSSAERSSTNGVGEKRKPLADAPPDTAKLPDCPIGAVELMTFFPNHFLRPEIGHRIRGAGHHVHHIAFVQLRARGKLASTLDPDERAGVLKSQQATLRHQVIKNTKLLFGNDMRPKNFYESFIPPPDPDYIVNQASIRQSKGVRTEDAKATRLVDIAKGVVNWPSGEDAGICSKVIFHAQQNGLAKLTTDDIPIVAQQLGFTMPAEASTNLWDQKAAERVQQAIDGKH